MSNRHLFTNNATTKLTSAISADTSIILVDDASSFPNPANGDYFLLTLDNGTDIEIIKVNSRNGDSLDDCIRGQEGTSPSEFQQGVLIELRPTAETLSSFARLEDRLGEVAGLHLVPSPSSVLGNSYLTGSVDDSGLPIVTIRQGAKWKLLSHPERLLSFTQTTAGTRTSLSMPDASNLLPSFVTGKYVAQYSNGLNIGLPRLISAVSGNTIFWADNLPAVTAVGDVVEIYKSTYSSITDLRITSSQITLTFDPVTAFNTDLAAT